MISGDHFLEISSGLVPGLFSIRLKTTLQRNVLLCFSGKLVANKQLGSFEGSFRDTAVLIANEYAGGREFKLPSQFEFPATKQLNEMPIKTECQKLINCLSMWDSNYLPYFAMA